VRDALTLKNTYQNCKVESTQAHSLARSRRPKSCSFLLDQNICVAFNQDQQVTQLLDQNSDKVACQKLMPPT
jgi:hypothetical protein